MKKLVSFMSLMVGIDLFLALLLSTCQKEIPQTGDAVGIVFSIMITGALLSFGLIYGSDE